MSDTRPIDPPASDRPATWVFIGGALLAGVAGCVNALLLSSSFHVPVSHMTGAVTVFALDASRGAGGDLVKILAILGGFLVGAVVSGMIIGGTSLRSGRRYGVALGVEGAIFAFAAATIADTGVVGLCAAAAGCGLQNGMASTYLGLILRTTHVTGIVTDLGVLLGGRIRGDAIAWWKVALLALLLAAFVAGCFLGVWFHRAIPDLGLWIISAGLLVAGAGYWWHRHRQRPEVPVQCPEVRKSGSPEVFERRP